MCPYVEKNFVFDVLRLQRLYVYSYYGSIV